jgi:inner membrane protein
MDNLTHSLVGLTVAKAGLQKLSPAATTVCVLAANAPDSDVVVGLFADRWTLLHHHRGITHAIVGALTLAILLPLIVYGIDRLIARWRGRAPTVQLRGLFIASLIATATHPFLDWMNNYGVRPLLPWNSRWFYGDLLYIVDPFMWLMLGGAAFLLTSRTKFQRILWLALGVLLSWLVIFGPGRREFSSPRVLIGLWIAIVVLLIVLFVMKAGQRWGAQIAFVSLVLVACYLIGLGVAHRRAGSVATSVAQAIANEHQESVARLAVMPTLANPFRWDCAFETDAATYRFSLGIPNGDRDSILIRYPKPTGVLAAAIQQVSDDRRTKIFLDFARFPVARLQDPACTKETLVQFADLRYTEPGRARASFTLDLTFNCQSLGNR